MFWIKSNNLKTKNDYLYLRETVYIRDKRSLKRIPRKLGNGDATKNRGKYSKKKDIYCGRIYNIELKQINTFNEYLEIIKKQQTDFLEYKLNSSFDKILYDFVDYLLHIYNIEKEDFFSNKKKAYFTGNGFLCKETIDYILRFKLKVGNSNEKKDFERFALRCIDCAIFDEEIISVLYMKLNHASKKQEEEIIKIEKGNYSNYQEFMKNQYNNSNN